MFLWRWHSRRTLRTGRPMRGFNASLIASGQPALSRKLDSCAPRAVHWEALVMPSERRWLVWSGIAKVPIMSTGRSMPICGT